MKAAKVVTCSIATKLQTSLEAGSSWTAMPAPAPNSHSGSSWQQLQWLACGKETACLVRLVIWRLLVRVPPLQSVPFCACSRAGMEVCLSVAAAAAAIAGCMSANGGQLKDYDVQ